MSSQKIKLGITGGIGSGKSYICQLLEKQGIPVFYCDIEARNEIICNAGLRHRLKLLVGNDLYSEEGMLNKTLMRNFLCQGPQAAEQVNALVHPCVMQCFLQWAGLQSSHIIAMECALLFETGFHRLVHRSLLVTAPEETRIQRVMKRDGLTREKIRAIMSLQMPDSEKTLLADFTITNDGITPLLPQLHSVLSEISFF